MPRYDPAKKPNNYLLRELFEDWLSTSCVTRHKDAYTSAQELVLILSLFAPGCSSRDQVKEALSLLRDKAITNATIQAEVRLPLITDARHALEVQAWNAANGDNLLDDVRTLASLQRHFDAAALAA